MLYQALGLISFFTVGEDEVKHSQSHEEHLRRRRQVQYTRILRRLYPCWEVISFEDFKESGSVSVARSKGLYRLEGKDYTVQDGDIITFRFSK